MEYDEKFSTQIETRSAILFKQLKMIGI